jgi:hypothetical protein
MTLSNFDPVCLGQYPKGKEPIVLHFQYESSGEDVFRYILVDRIPITEIDVATRRKADEGPSAEAVRAKYLPKPQAKVIKEPEVEVTEFNALRIEEPIEEPIEKPKKTKAKKRSK